nr:MAG TPA_asm: Protein of unknown function (DUF551) [Caudoviricetes sp.]
MTAKEIITALRCTAIVDRHEDCAGCPYHVVEQVPGEDMESFGTETWESCDVDKVALDAAAALERMVWIPVTERLPEPGKRVLATDGVFVGEAYKTTAGTWWRHAGMPWRTVLDGRVVTHWMELPEAPGDV